MTRRKLAAPQRRQDGTRTPVIDCIFIQSTCEAQIARAALAAETGLGGQTGLPGKFSGLQLLSIMYAAFQQIDPTADIGADFKAEYEAAVKMQR